MAARGLARTCTHVVDSCDDDDSNAIEYGIGAFKGAWKTTCASRLCVVILRAVRSDGGNATMWKPEDFAPILRDISTFQAFKDPSLYEAYANMTYGERRNWGEVKSNRSTHPKRTKLIESKYNMYTFITMPVEELTSEEKETKWCNEAVEKLLRNIVTTVSGDYFKAAVMARAEKYKKPHLKTIIDESSYFSMQRYLEHCYVSTYKIEKTKKYMSGTVTNDIMTHLWQNQRKQSDGKKKASIDKDRYFAPK